jgi:OOP family OmpA-OmpF porin
MKIVITGLIIFIAGICLSQKSVLNPIQGTWKGVLLKDAQKESEAIVFYLDLVIKDGEITGKTREELYDTDLFAVKRIKGKIDGNKFNFNEFVIETQKSSSKTTWCNSDFVCVYTDSTGYITGSFSSSNCKRLSGKIVLYRSLEKFKDKEEKLLSHVWRDDLLKDIKSGRKAPEIREKEMKNFKFQAIYFDHDKTEIKQEFHAYLKEMIRVVNGHSDLRIQITGHTDNVGSNSYNEDLSRRRAKSIEDFFKANGLELKKLKIDFKGESEPIDNNQTEEGKRKNRRVDFKFI